MSDSGSELNPKQKRFAEEYLIDNNATQAAIRAGYSAKTARTVSARLLADVRIKSHVEEMRREQSLRVGCTADQILAEIRYLAMSRITDIVTFTGDSFSCKDSESLPDPVKAAISSISSTVTTKRGEVLEVKHTIKMHSKTWALDKLSKLMGVDKEHCLKAVIGMGFQVINPNTGEVVSFDDGAGSDDTTGDSSEDQE